MQTTIKNPLGVGANFSYFDQNGNWSAVNMTNGTTIELAVGQFNVKVTANVGRTPGTYHSGNRSVATLTFSCDEPSLIIKEVTKSGTSNDDAIKKVMATGAIIDFAPSGASCKGIVFLKREMIENDLGTVEVTTVVKQKIYIGSLKRSDIKDYLVGIIPTGNIYGTFGVTFSGWKSPNNLLEGENPYRLGYLKSLEYQGKNYSTFVPYAYSSECSYEQAEETVLKAIKEHLDSLNFPPEVEEKNETTTRTGTPKRRVAGPGNGGRRPVGK